MPHKFGDFRHLELNGRIRKRATEHPARHRVTVRRVLTNLGFRYREAVPFLNPYWDGNKHQFPDGNVQWLDFVFQLPSKELAIILFDGHIGGGYTEIEIRATEAKRKFLAEKDIPMLLVPTHYTSQEYEIRILMLIRRKENENAH